MDKLGVEPDAIIIPVGGGGLLAGMVTVIKHLKPHMEIIVCVYRNFTIPCYIYRNWHCAADGDVMC